jgi:hypothetical protein
MIPLKVRKAYRRRAVLINVKKVEQKWLYSYSFYFLSFAEGTGIDLEEDSQLEEALPVRLPATLLALEDTGLGDGDGEAGNYRVSCQPNKFPSFNLVSSIFIAQKKNLNLV